RHRRGSGDGMAATEGPEKPGDPSCAEGSRREVPYLAGGPARIWHLADSTPVGCRGFNGPVPPPLLIRALQLSGDPTGRRRCVSTRPGGGERGKSGAGPVPRASPRRPHLDRLADLDRVVHRVRAPLEPAAVVDRDPRPAHDVGVEPRLARPPAGA